MGHAVGAQLINTNVNVITALEGRSERTKSLAKYAKIQDVGTFTNLVKDSDLIISILVPSQAIPFAKTISDSIKSLDKSLKIGHGGTLDPLATGILPILFNSATKYFEYFLHLNKIYEAEITFGISTDTYDLEGLILEKKNDLNIELNKIKEHLIKRNGSKHL